MLLILLILSIQCQCIMTISRNTSLEAFVCVCLRNHHSKIFDYFPNLNTKVQEKGFLFLLSGDIKEYIDFLIFNIHEEAKKFHLS